MGTQATRMKMEEPQSVSQGTPFLLVVGLSTVFALLLALMNVKSGPLFTEGNMLFATLIFYSAASALYIGFGVTGTARFAKFASAALALGFVMNTLAAGHRWSVAGRPPFASIYEMLLSFVWTVALLTLVTERKYGVKLIGSVTAPLAVVSVTLMQLLNSDVRPLVPALQSTWLHIHVTLAMLAYAACAMSFATALMFLIKDNIKSETLLALTSGSTSLIYAAIVATRFDGGALSVVGWDAENKQDAILQGGARLFVNIPELGWLFVLATLITAAPVVLYFVAKVQNKDNLLGVANTAIFISLAVQVLTLAAFFLRANGGAYPPADPLNSTVMEMMQNPAFRNGFPTALPASPFILSGMLSGIFASLLYLMLHWRRTGLENLLPSADTLDRVTYKTICVAFPLLTLMIASGAYWANQAWGTYWQWDPKETWAAITWLVYAGYLHMRLTRGWRGRRAAYFAILGFAVVMFTFFGVTYLLPGLHAYA